MIKLIFPAPMLSELAAVMRADARESFALILARPAPAVANGWRLLVDSIHLPTADELEVQSDTRVPAERCFPPAVGEARTAGGFGAGLRAQPSV
jgi:hypothetical protein